MMIREANPADFDYVMAFYYDLIDSMQEAEYRPKWEKDVYPARQFIKDSIAHNALIIAVIDGAIVGAMVVDQNCAESYDQAAWGIDANRDEIAVIHALGIATRLQSRGLAKKMVAHAIDDGRKKGLKAIRLDALPTNIPAHRLYLSMGFTYVGTIQIYYEDTGLTDFYLFELCI